MDFNPTTVLKAFQDEYHPVDLGFDNFDDEAPIHVRKALANATTSDDPAINQCTDGSDLPRLRQVIAKLYSQLIGQQLNPNENILVTVGAIEATYLAIMAHTAAGDEWLIIEPAYHIFLPIVRQAGGVAKLISLRLKKLDDIPSGEDWELDRNEFERLISKKTKGIILNNPQNPIGRVWSMEELEFIGTSLPRLYERIITLGSAGKSFSLNGWRLGWAYAPKTLLDPMTKLHMNIVHCAPTLQQVAIAFALEEEIRNFGSSNSYFVTQRQYIKHRCDILTKTFADVGLKPINANGGFCMLVDWTPIQNKMSQIINSMDFLKWLIKEIGVLGLPGTAYFREKQQYIGQNYARFCFDTIEKAVEKLQKLKDFL